MIDRTDDLDPTHVEIPSLSVADADLAKAVFIIPLDAPLPNELADAVVPSGTLLTRLSALNLTAEEAGAGFDFVPLAGTELTALERPWRALQAREHVYVLTEIPGARYDVLFDQARRAIGLRSLDWPSVAAAMASHQRVMQRTTDTSPWAVAKPGRSGPRSTLGKEQVPIPESDEQVD